MVYANNPATLDGLKDNIQREIANVPVEMCARVVDNWVQRIDRFAFKYQYIIRKTKELKRTIASIATADHFYVI